MKIIFLSAIGTECDVQLASTRRLTSEEWDEVEMLIAIARRPTDRESGAKRGTNGQGAEVIHVAE